MAQAATVRRQAPQQAIEQLMVPLQRAALFRLHLLPLAMEPRAVVPRQVTPLVVPLGTALQALLPPLEAAV